jgi:adenine deaminase
MSWGRDVIGLGEVMNFPDVVYGDDRMLGEIAATLRSGKVVDGHFTWPANDWRLPVYAAAGVSGDHECVTPEDVVERVRLGMYAKMRQGSAWQDVARTIRAHTELGIDPRRMVLVTDDRSAESLLDEGHMDFVVRLAIRQGVKPVTAFQMATLNTAERFGVARDVGSVTPGSFGDVILLDGALTDVNVGMTIAAGQVVAENGRMTADWPSFIYPASARQTVHVGRELTAADFEIPAPVASGPLMARVIEPIENHAETKERFVQVKAEKGSIRLEPSSGLCKIAVFERHFETGGKAAALLAGIGFDRPAAIAMTVAHDSHNLLVIGNDDALMSAAANSVIGCQGGIAVLGAGEPVLFGLPVAGLMSDADPEAVAERSRAVGQVLKDVGCRLNSALMTLSLLALVVIPELRLSDKGLVRISPDGIRKVSLFPDFE